MIVLSVKLRNLLLYLLINLKLNKNTQLTMIYLPSNSLINHNIEPLIRLLSLFAGGPSKLLSGIIGLVIYLFGNKLLCYTEKILLQACPKYTFQLLALCWVPYISIRVYNRSIRHIPSPFTPLQNEPKYLFKPALCYSVIRWSFICQNNQK